MSQTHATNPQPRDQMSYKWAGLALQVGMYVSFGFMLVGLVWWLLAGAPGGEGSAREGMSITRLVPELLKGNPLAILNLGVALLLITPAAALFALIITYAAARNRRFALVSLLIGAILTVSMIVSLFR